MGIITLLISLAFSFNFINSTVSTNYLATHQVAMNFQPYPIYPKKDINPIFQFNNNYITSYHEDDTKVMLSVSINTSNLDLSNKIYWVNMYGGIMGSMLPLKWTYSFNTNIPDSSTTQAINLSKIGYDYTQPKLYLNSLINLYQFDSFVDKFFQDATIKLPFKMLIACTPYSDVTNYLTLKGPYYSHNPNLTFSRWVTYKLFNAPDFHIENHKFWYLNFPVTKNKLFLAINLSNCNLNYLMQLRMVRQLDRYMVCQGTHLNYEYKPTYSNQVVGNINLKITDLLPYDYCFNPHDLFHTIMPGLQASNEWAYASFPNLKFRINSFLLEKCLDANLIAQLYDIINNYATSINNHTLLKLNNELWTKGMWSSLLATKVFSLINNTQTYNPTTNTLAVNFGKNLAAQSLINYLQMDLTKNQIASWYGYLQLMTGIKTSLNLTPTNCINLYQSLLRTYQGCKMEYYLQTKNNWIGYDITYENLSIALNANNCCKYVLPYDYYYNIEEAIFTFGNYSQLLDTSWGEFNIIKYPQVISNYVVNLPPVNNLAKSQYQTYIFPLQLFSDLPSITLFNLEQTYDLTSSELTRKIKQFNANYNDSISTFNNYLKNKLTNSLIDLSIYYTFFNLFSDGQNIIKYCNEHGFDNNLLATSNNSLMSDFKVKVDNATKGTYSVTFNINNQLDLMPLFNNYCIYVPWMLSPRQYNSNIEMFFYLPIKPLAPTPVKKVVPPPVKVTPVKKIVVPKPVKKIVPVPKPVKKVVVKPTPPPVVNHHIVKKQPIKPVVIPTPVHKPLIINNSQPVVNKPTPIPSWGYFLIVLPIILVILGFGGFLVYLKVKALMLKKKQKQ